MTNRADLSPAAERILQAMIVALERQEGGLYLDLEDPHSAVIDGEVDLAVIAAEIAAITA
jgi:hypothetical protein